MAERAIARSCRDLVSVQYNKDGSIRAFGADYADVNPETDFAEIDSGLQDYYASLAQQGEFAPYERIEPYVEDKYYLNLDGTVYGFYGVTIECITDPAPEDGGWPRAARMVMLRAE